MSRPSAAGSGLAGPNSSRNGRSPGLRTAPDSPSRDSAPARFDSFYPTAGGLYRLVPNSAEGIFPAFAPDGVHLAFSVIRAGESEGEMATGSASDFFGTAIRVVDLSTGGTGCSPHGAGGSTSSPGPTRPTARPCWRPAARARRHPSSWRSTSRPVRGHRCSPMRQIRSTRPTAPGSRSSENGSRRRGRRDRVDADLFVADSDGSNVVRVTHTPKTTRPGRAGIPPGSGSRSRRSPRKRRRRRAAGLDRPGQRRRHLPPRAPSRRRLGLLRGRLASGPRPRGGPIPC